MDSSYSEGPVNIGTVDEGTVLSWAEEILSIVKELRASGAIAPLSPGQPESRIEFVPAVVDDPPRRKPDISRAKAELGWEPKWPVRAGLEETILSFARQLAEGQN
ncbi:hypothetical protein JCM3774_004860 [Rhodotorula dairenensis]